MFYFLLISWRKLISVSFQLSLHIIFQLADQRRRLGGADDSTYNVRDFLDDSASEVSEIHSTWCQQ